jgi:hypothetical protein
MTAAQQARGADAAVWPKVVAFLKTGIDPIVFPIYNGGAAHALAVSPPCALSKAKLDALLPSVFI